MDLKIDKKLGSGSYGTVYSAIDKEGNIYAVKEQYEISIPELLMGKMDHPNLQRYISVSENKDLIKVISTPVGVPLQKLLKDVNFSMEDRFKVIGDIANALNHLHINGLIHSDLHIGNVVWSNDKAVLIDYGAAAIGRGECGDDYFNYERDLYNLSLVILQLLTRQLEDDYKIEVDDIVKNEQELEKLYTLAKIDDPLRWALLTNRLANAELTTTQLVYLLGLEPNAYLLPQETYVWIKDLKQCYHQMINNIVKLNRLDFPYFLVLYMAIIYATTNLNLAESAYAGLAPLYTKKDVPTNKQMIESNIGRPLIVETLEDALKIHKCIETYSDIDPIELQNSFDEIVSFGEVMKKFKD